ncbi:MAG TPA: LCCL domain-containing protein [Rubricoccaceae bacterium]|nr:LCCL domain-containing protein [Rubricoccaceae bacterium]
MRLLHLVLPALLLGGCAAAGHALGTTHETTTHAGTDWSTSVSEYRGRVGQHVTFACPPNPAREGLGTVWGAEVYTDDSAVCVAAVHAGRLSFERGGRVAVEIRPGQDGYRGTDWNGVVSQPYGAWGGSFVFVER